MIGHVEDIPPGERLITTVAGRSVGVFNVNGSFYALKNVCIHNQAPVCLGDVAGAYLSSAPDKFVLGIGRTGVA